MNFSFVKSVYLILAILLVGCASNQSHYAKPLYEMEVLDTAEEGGPGQEEFPEGNLMRLSPGERPSLDSDEAGLWMIMDKTEEDYKTSGKRINDEKLNAYLQDVTCRLTPEYCRDIRIYVMEVPYFNAFMAPNGAMVIWSGLLLRVRNEAQLASVLGHEIAHYLQRHSLQQMRNAINTSSAIAFLRLATAVAGVGFVGDMAAIASAGGFRAYGRDMEREADGYGMAMLTRAGYDPRESGRVWQQIIEEKEASEDSSFSILLFDSHPPEEERLEALNRFADRIVARGSDYQTAEQRYQEVLAPFLYDFLKDELHLREFARLEILTNTLLEYELDHGVIYFFQGEMYRLRGKEGDIEKAMQSYQKASLEEDCPPEAFRSLGLLNRKNGNGEEARRCFSEYLERTPDAVDREMIMDMLKRSRQ